MGIVGGENVFCLLFWECLDIRKGEVVFFLGLVFFRNDLVINRNKFISFSGSFWCVLVRMIIMNNDCDYYYYCVSYLGMGRVVCFVDVCVFLGEV